MSVADPKMEPMTDPMKGPMVDPMTHPMTNHMMDPKTDTVTLLKIHKPAQPCFFIFTSHILTHNLGYLGYNLG